MTSRMGDIKQKLSYLMGRYELLRAEILLAERSDENIEHLGIKVGEILGGCRECLDYCIKDVVSELLGIDEDGLKVVYFPFSRKKILEDKKIFQKIRDIKPNAYDFFETLMVKIDNNNEMDGVSPIFGFSILRVINDIVNEKKHNKINRVSVMHQAKTLIEHPSGVSVSFVAYNVTDNGPVYLPASPVLINKDSSQRPISALMLEGYEASELCACAINASSLVIRDVYEKVFNLEDGEVHPKRLLQSYDERMGEKILASLNPLRVRPMKITLMKKGLCVLELKCNSEGSFKPEDGSLVALVRFLLEVYKSRILAHAFGQFRDIIKSNWKVFKGGASGTDVVSGVVFPVVHEIAVFEGPVFSFDEIRFHQAGWVRHEPVLFKEWSFVSSELWQLTVRILFGEDDGVVKFLADNGFVKQVKGFPARLEGPVRWVIAEDSEEGVVIKSIEKNEVIK